MTHCEQGTGQINAEQGSIILKSNFSPVVPVSDYMCVCVCVWGGGGYMCSNNVLHRLS